MWIPVGVALVTGGVLAGYLVRGSSPAARTAPADAAASIATAPADAAASVAITPDAAPPTSGVVRVDPETKARFAQTLAELEGQLRDNGDKMQPHELQSMYKGALSMVCVLQDEAKAKQYFAKLTSASERRDAQLVCSQYGVRL